MELSMKIYLLAVAVSLGAVILIVSACMLREGGQRLTPVHISLFH
jgi:hypothetical protein